MGEGMTLERLRVIIEAYTQPYREELERVKNQTSRATQEVDRQTTKMAKSYNKVGRAVKAVIGALSIGAIIAFGKSCVDLGSDLQMPLLKMPLPSLAYLKRWLRSTWAHMEQWQRRSDIAQNRHMICLLPLLD